MGHPRGQNREKGSRKGHKLIIAVKMAKRSMSFGIEKFFGTRNSMVKSDFDKIYFLTLFRGHGGQNWGQKGSK